MTSSAPEIAERAQRSAIRGLRSIASIASAEVRTGEGWLAVRTGVLSNDFNGVTSDPGAVLPTELVEELSRWVTADDRPASWLIEVPDRALAEVLIGLGAHPERTGNWCGADLVDLGSTARDDDVRIAAVQTEDELAEWLDLAEACGWTGPDRHARARVYRELGLVDGPLQHWIARVDGRPAGFATARLSDAVVELCDLGVLEQSRRRGVGRALATHRLLHAAAEGARYAVAAPSGDGWALYRTLGFDLASVIRDLCFYLEPGRA